MWVDPAARGSGIGRALVEEIVRWARSDGSPVLRLRVTQSNDAAVRLYTRAGFSDEGLRLPLREGSDVTTMSMTMDPQGTRTTLKWPAPPTSSWNARCPSASGIVVIHPDASSAPSFNSSTARAKSPSPHA